MNCSFGKQFEFAEMEVDVVDESLLAAVAPTSGLEQLDFAVDAICQPVGDVQHDRVKDAPKVFFCSCSGLDRTEEASHRPAEPSVPGNFCPGDRRVAPKRHGKVLDRSGACGFQRRVARPLEAVRFVDCDGEDSCDIELVEGDLGLSARHKLERCIDECRPHVHRHAPAVLKLRRRKASIPLLQRAFPLISSDMNNAALAMVGGHCDVVAALSERVLVEGMRNSNFRLLLHVRYNLHCIRVLQSSRVSLV